MDDDTLAVEGSTASVHKGDLAQAKASAVANGWVVINEAPERGKCIVRQVECGPSPLPLASFPGGPWRVHRAPVSVVVGLGCGSALVQDERIEAAMRAMLDTGIGSLLWVGSKNDWRKGLPERLGHCAAQVFAADPPRRFRQEIDTQSKSTQGNARFCMERLRDGYLYPRAVARIVLVTSDFHIERARMIFHRAAEAILRPAGHRWYIECRGCVTPKDAPPKFLKQAIPAEKEQRERLQAGVKECSSDETVRQWI